MHASLRAIRALTIALALLLPAASTVAAGGPSRPVAGHHPRFVTEREFGRWQDCLWASAAMLVDKWTAGRILISKDDLRALSGDRKGGSNVDHLALALRRLGLTARTSPNGGAVITWARLRARLSAGGGAILLGDDSHLPRWYGRWDPQFWNNTGEKDNHAIYLDRYDRRHDRYWMMDPLAPADWAGEWISGRDLRAYAWSAPNGGLSGLMTPAAAKPSFAGVRLRGLIASIGPNEVHLGWSITRKPRHWARPRVDVVVKVTAATQVMPSPRDIVLSAPPVGSAPGAAALRGPTHPASVRLGSKTLNATIPYPAAGGTYHVAVAVRERRFRRTVASSTLTLYVPGDRWATITTSPLTGPIPVGSLELSADVTNSGSTSWGESSLSSGVPLALSSPRNTRLVATWVLLNANGSPVVRPVAAGTATAGVAAAGLADAPLGPIGPAPVTFDALPLAPGQHATVTGTLATPAMPGHWALILDIVDDTDGSFADHGSRPATMVVDVVEPIAGQPPRN